MHLVSNERFLTPSEAAKQLGVHINTIYQWVDSGKLAATRISENAIRIDPADANQQKAIQEEKKARLMTIKEVARELRLSPMTVHRLIADGKLPVVRVTQKRFCIERIEVEAYLESRKSK